MKRMVLIPEEKLLQYEQQKGDVSRDIKDLPNGEKKRKRGSYRTMSLSKEFQRL